MNLETRYNELNKDYGAYELVNIEKLNDLNSVGLLLKHKKSGARVAIISNDDDNKVFSIGFKTPPDNDTGMQHIIEHSTLCGSRKYPVKDPFVELCKGSLNTFLNAMTYPDKTVYPVASCNMADFKNIMDVYMDAVFYPAMYEHDEIFKQEGWHYELEDIDGELAYNGVVFNEMKGVYSSADDVLSRYTFVSLFPDSEYKNESGGDPEAIPQLKYEDFIKYHKEYYHPVNSYIYLYGDIDVNERLEYLDKEYLSAFDKNDVNIDAEITFQKAFDAPKYETREYAITDDEPEEDNTYLSYNVVIGTSTDPVSYLALQILDYALIMAPGAPLKQALIDAGIGTDVYSVLETSVYQPVYSIITKNANESDRDRFIKVVEDTLSDIVKNGLSKRMVKAGINYYEFKYREADFGSYPKGLMYGLQVLDSWLYDDKLPFVHIEANETFAGLRKEVGSGYFEGLVQKYLLDNPHRSVVILKPKFGLLEEQEQKQREKMAKVKASMSPEEIEKVKDTFRKLTEFQESEDAKEDLEKIPLLKREDMKKEANLPVNEVRKIGDTTLLYHNLFTNGIGYLRLIFKLDQIPGKYFPYIGILKGCLGLLNTEHYEYGDLFNEMNLVTGGMAAVNNVYGKLQDTDQFTLTLELKTKVFYDRIAEAIDLMREIVMTSDFTDTKRLYEILAEGKSRMQAQMTSGGHSVASGRAMSYGSIPGAVSEEISGIPFYRLTADLEAHFDGKKEELAEILQTLLKMIFRPENLMVDFIGEEKAVALLDAPVEAFKAALYTEDVEKEHYIPEVSRKNEGFLTSGQVNYVCRAGNFRKSGLKYTGALRVLKVMMGYEYLWVNVRVKGGAYGCSFGRSGDSYFVSYRDPNLGKTIEIYEKAADAIAEFTADERTMTQYIIGAVSDLDVPMNPAAKGLYSLSAYMTGLDDATLQRERDELLAATQEDIRALSAHIRAFMQENLLCVVGTASKVKEEQERFLKVENLF